jgi:type IX secretion system PorP/SprF family membrane protein
MPAIFRFSPSAAYFRPVFTERSVFAFLFSFIVHRRMKKLFTLFLCGSLAWSIQAQDARYSQFYMNPLRLNPAMTGVFEGSLRVYGNYRSQWAGIFGKNAFTTYSVGADYRLLGRKNDFCGVGLTVLNDKAGSLGLSHLEAQVSFSYQKMLGRPKAWKKGNKFLCAGAQMGFGQRSFDLSAAQTSSQFNGDGFDPNLANGEGGGLRNNKTLVDMSAGVMWYGVYGPRRSFYAGASAAHLSQPDVSLISGRRDPLYMRWTLHTGGELQLGRYKRNKSPLSLVPGLVVMGQGPSMEINMGTSLKFQKERDDVAFRLGGWFRLVNSFRSGAPGGESFIATTGIDLKNVQIALSYDTNVSALSPISQGRGALELHLMYINPNKGSRNFGCPTF